MIGISPGTRSIGLAVIKDGVLIDWGVKMFKEEWSNEKLVRVIKTLETYIIRYNVSRMALKQVHASRSSVGLEKLVNSIRLLARRLNVRCYIYNIDDLKKVCGGASSKNGLMDFVFQNYPEVQKGMTLTSGNIAYHLKTIEAVALVHVLG